MTLSTHWRTVTRDVCGTIADTGIGYAVNMTRMGGEWAIHDVKIDGVEIAPSRPTAPDSRRGKHAVAEREAINALCDTLDAVSEALFVEPASVASRIIRRLQF